MEEYLASQGPQQADCFVWTAARRKFSTMDDLKKL